MRYYLKKDSKKLIPVLIICFIVLIIFLISMLVSTIKEKNFKTTLENLMKKASTETYTEQGINVLDLNIKNIKYGAVIKNESGVLELLNVSDGDFCGNGEINKVKITKGDCDNSIPSCNLIITSGTLGFNNWYTSTPYVTLKTSSALSSGLYYGIGYEENYQDIKLDLNQIGIINYKVDKNGTKKLFGYVKNGVGKKATCEVELKVDLEKPTIKDIVKKNNEISFTLEDNMGVTSYIITTGSTAPKEGYSSIKSTKNKNVIYTLPDDQKYYIYAIDEAGNISQEEIK